MAWSKMFCKLAFASMVMLMMIKEISGVRYDQNNVPLKWHNKYYKNGSFDFERLQELCNAFDFDFDEACTADGTGYLYCDWKNNYQLKTRKCNDGFVCGKCKENGYWPYEGLCRCIDATKPPKFPTTGRITWTGHKQFKDGWGGGWQEKKPMKGAIQFTTDGIYLFHSIDHKSTSVTIIIPNTDGSFIEYKGDGKGGECKRTETSVDNRKQLTWLWVYMSRDAIHTYEIQEKGSIQKWGLMHDYDWEESSSSANHDKWWMTVKLMDGSGKIGIPVKFYMENASDDDYWYTHTNFKYLNTDQFKLSDYCPGAE